MSLVGPWLTTNSTKKRKNKISKAKLQELEQGWRSRNEVLKSINVPKQTFEEYMEWVYGKGKKAPKKETHRSDTKTPVAEGVPSNPRNSSHCEFDALGAIGGVGALGASPGAADRHKNNRNTSWITGPCTTKPSPTYTGSKILGIATMHKSNLVPIFSDDDAKDVASMRR